jgi:UrcA family protein
MKNATSSRIVTIGKSLAAAAVATLLASAALSPAAYAATGDDVPSVIVKYDAVRAATERGALELYGRLVYAARRVCPSDIRTDLAGVAQAHQCQKEALARAVSQIHERHLVEIAAARSGLG